MEIFQKIIVFMILATLVILAIGEVTSDLVSRTFGENTFY